LKFVLINFGLSYFSDELSGAGSSSLLVGYYFALV